MNNISGKSSLTLNNISGSSNIGGSTFKVSDLANQDVTVNSITANSVNSLQVNTIDSISVKDSSILLNQGSTTDVNNTGIYLQHSSNKFSGLVKEKTSGLFKLVDLSALPSLTSTFTLAQAAGLTVSDLVSSGSVKFTNSNGYSTNIKASSTQSNNIDITLPTVQPVNNEVLTANATGSLYWSSKSDIGPQILTVNTNSNSGSKAIAFKNDTSNFSAMTGDFMFLKNMANSSYSTVSSSSIPANYASITCNDVNVGYAGNVNFINTSGKKTSIGPNPTQSADIKLMLPNTAPGNNTFLGSAGTSNGVTTLQWLPASIPSEIYNSAVYTDNLKVNTRLAVGTDTNSLAKIYSLNDESTGTNSWYQINCHSIRNSDGRVFGNLINFSSDRYQEQALINGNYYRNNAPWQFGLRENPNTTNYLDFFYIGRSGLSSNDFFIQQNGCIGMGAPLGTTLSYKLYVTGDVYKTVGGSGWNVPSDNRVKEDITDADITQCYNNVKALKLKRFKWSEHYMPDVPDRNVCGWIAQEAMTVFPRSVKIKPNTFIVHKAETEKDDITETIEDFHHLNDDEIYKSLYGCVHKLIEKVETLEEGFRPLTARINQLETLAAQSASNNLDLLSRLQAIELKTYNL